MSDAQTRPSGSSVSDLEVKDAQIIFDSVWASLEREFGRAKLSFPREIFWLNGAPGAGKGTNTQFILQYRDYGAEPIVVSDLLSSPEAKKRIDAGMLVGDREVVEQSSAPRKLRWGRCRRTVHRAITVEVRSPERG